MPIRTTEQTYPNITNDIRLRMPTVGNSDMDWRDKVVLIVEDEKQMADLLATIFGLEGAKAYVAGDGETGLRSLSQYSPDLLLLDMRLPGIDGFEVLRAARRKSDVPLVIVTAVSQHELLIGGLLAGADDCLTKPFRRDELLARSWAAVRRGHMNGSLLSNNAYDDGYLALNLGARTVRVEGKRVKLTATEFSLLAYLISRRSHACTFEQIMNHVWNDVSRDSTGVIPVFVWQIRQKIEPNPKKPTYLVSEHSVGYRFVDHKVTD
ncbi:MAG: response regulator transcription factor [Candidatus Promineifilaceae bacterium]